MRLLICGLEGTLTPLVCADLLMGSIENGERLLRRLRRYEELLLQAKREEAQPEAHLAYLLPFLALHQVDASAVAVAAEGAPLLAGAQALPAALQQMGWEVAILSGGYEPFVRRLAASLGVDPANVIATPLPPMAKYSRYEQDAGLEVEEEILALPEEEDQALLETLDRFFGLDLIATPLGQAVRELRPLAGERLVTSAKELVGSLGLSWPSVAVIASNGGEARLLKAIQEGSGLAIAFNAEASALAAASVGVASPSVEELFPLLLAWELGGLEGAEAFVRGQEGRGQGPPHYAWIPGQRGLGPVLEPHTAVRQRLTSGAKEL